MLSQRGMFVRSSVGELLGPAGSMGLDNGSDLLTSGERKALDDACSCKDRGKPLDGDVADHAVSEGCVSGMRVLRRSDSDNSPTAAEVCSADGAQASGHPVGTQLTAAQITQLGGNLAALFQGVNNVFNPAKPPPPPPSTIVPGVPNFVTLGAAALVVVVIVWRVVKK